MRKQEKPWTWGERLYVVVLTVIALAIVAAAGVPVQMARESMQELER